MPPDDRPGVFSAAMLAHADECAFSPKDEMRPRCAQPGTDVGTIARVCALRHNDSHPGCCLGTGGANLTFALIAAAAAVAGGLLAAYATRSVEAMLVRAALVGKAQERRLASIERFLLAANAWLDWLTYMAEQPSQDHYPELNRRVKERDDAYRQLILLASDRLHHWLINAYVLLEYELKRTYAYEVRYLKPVTEHARNLRVEFSRFLREDLI